MQMLFLVDSAINVGWIFSCTEFEEEEEVMMAAEVSILPVWSNQDIRNFQKADTMPWSG